MIQITVAPIETFAIANALTHREWEALARAAAVIEVDVTAALTEVEPKMSMTVQLESTQRSTVVALVRNVLDSVGLRSMEWFIYLQPVLDDCVMPIKVQKWMLHLRLYEKNTKAVQNVKATKAVVEDHKPTLAEQFGKKNES